MVYFFYSKTIQDFTIQTNTEDTNSSSVALLRSSNWNVLEIRKYEMYTLLNLAFFGPIKYVFVNILFLLSYCHFIKKNLGKKIQCIYHNKKILYRNHRNLICVKAWKSNSTKYIGSFLLQFVYKNGFELSSIEQKTDGFRWWHSFVMFCFWQIKVLKFKIKRIFVKLIYFIEGVHFRWILLEDFFLSF